jgi:hypothetical protein
MKSQGCMTSGGRMQGVQAGADAISSHSRLLFGSVFLNTHQMIRTRTCAIALLVAAEE